MPASADKPSLTAYPRTEAFLRRTLVTAPVHFDSLLRPLRRCDLEQCKGMCCYDGIYLSLEEADVVAQLARTEADFFHGIGLHLPRKVVVRSSWENLISGKKTAVAPWPVPQTVEGFPPHFHATACVFHLADGRCGLQALSEAHGRHPWHFKPTGCWLHPLTSLYTDRPGLGLHDEKTDPCRLPHYDGFIAHALRPNRRARAAGLRGPPRGTGLSRPDRRAGLLRRDCRAARRSRPARGAEDGPRTGAVGATMSFFRLWLGSDILGAVQHCGANQVLAVIQTAAVAASSPAQARRRTHQPEQPRPKRSL